MLEDFPFSDIDKCDQTSKVAIAVRAFCRVRPLFWASPLDRQEGDNPKFSRCRTILQQMAPELYVEIPRVSDRGTVKKACWFVTQAAEAAVCLAEPDHLETWKNPRLSYAMPDIREASQSADELRQLVEACRSAALEVGGEVLAGQVVAAIRADLAAAIAGEPFGPLPA